MAPIPTLQYSYVHPDCGACDATIRYRLAGDGSWLDAQFDCLPVFPDNRNEECYKDLAGYSSSDGARGAFFGLSLISGLPADADGRVSRMFSFGRTTLPGSFLLERQGHSIEVQADAETKGLPFEWLFIEPEVCSIFSGRVVFDVEKGIPTACWIDEVNDDGSVESFGWSLVSASGLGGPVWMADARLDVGVPVEPDGIRFPPRAPEGAMPFGFYEALDYAASQSVEVRDFLARPRSYLMDSRLQSKGWYGTGDCGVACLRTDIWAWEIRLQDGKDRIVFNVTKELTTPGGISRFSMDAASPEVPVVSHGLFPTEPMEPLSAFWERAQADLGKHPASLTYKAAARGTPIGALEPFVEVGFSMARPAGPYPHVWYRGNGDIQLWRAAGAIDLS